MAKRGETRERWSTRKKDPAPPGVWRHPSGVWAIRYTCGAGCLHKEKVGPIKKTAIGAYHARRASGRATPGWCPAIERGAARRRAQARVRFVAYLAAFDTWRETHLPRSRKADQGKTTVLTQVIGDPWLDEITSRDIERALGDASEPPARPPLATGIGRFLSALFKRALRDGHVTHNPVRGVPTRRRTMRGSPISRTPRSRPSGMRSRPRTARTSW